MAEDDIDDDNDLIDDEPLPVKRDTRIFSRKKDKDDDKEEFEEDVFV